MYLHHCFYLIVDITDAVVQERTAVFNKIFDEANKELQSVSTCTTVHGPCKRNRMKTKILVNCEKFPEQSLQYVRL